MLKHEAQEGAKALAKYRAHLAECKARTEAIKLDPSESRLSNAIEKLSESGLVDVIDENLSLKFSPEEKLELFGKTKGLHSSTDKVTRYDFNLTVKRLHIEVETLYDFETNRSFRYDMSGIGPEKSNFTWGTIANLTSLHLGYYLPPHRMENLLGLPIFSDINIYRQMEAQARMHLPIYIHLGTSLSDVDYLQFDDTNPNVIEMKKMVKSNFTLPASPSSQEAIEMIETEFGRFSPKANGEGFQKKINLSCLVGRTQEDDPRSEVTFYRTHYGHAGNLVEKILEQRSPKKKAIILQADLAIWNKPSAQLSSHLDVTFAGCSSHARRPFKIHSDDDDGLCDKMLFYFLLLAKMETRIDQRGRTEKRTLYYRKRYGEKIWGKVLALALSVQSTKDLKNCNGHLVWPPSSKLAVACNYIINHYRELTVYLKFAKIKPDNNKVERALRPEKLFLANSKSKGTEWGRTCLDILRTIYMTCIAADVEYESYLKFTYKNKEALEKCPEKYTPFAFAKHLQALKEIKDYKNTG